MPYLLAYLLAINLFTFLTYGYDKRAARKHKWRTPEATLHLLALLGGTPAAFIAQRLFRHKTAKLSFQFVYWAIVAVHITAAVYVYSI